MEVIVGGYAQGKLQYVLHKTGYSRQDVFKGASEEIDKIYDFNILDQMHLLIRRLMEKGLEENQIVELLEQVVEKKPGLIIICDEVGSGVVPIEKDERIWREQVGRVMCRLVQIADHMERVMCGISQQLK